MSDNKGIHVGIFLPDPLLAYVGAGDDNFSPIREIEPVPDCRPTVVNRHRFFRGSFASVILFLRISLAVAAVHARLRKRRDILPKDILEVLQKDRIKIAVHRELALPIAVYLVLLFRKLFT